MIALDIQPTKESGQRSEPISPKCRSKMLQRVTKKGDKTGTPFWDCPNVPNCLGTLPFE